MDCNLIYVINESYDDTLIHDMLNNSLMFITYHKKRKKTINKVSRKIR